MKKMKMLMEKAKAWLMASNRWKHVVGGVAIGVCADSTWCAALAGVSTASALEWKDRAWGGMWDWTDWGCTVAGVAVGRMIGGLLWS